MDMQDYERPRWQSYIQEKCIQRSCQRGERSGERKSRQLGAHKEAQAIA